jgi:hypothetical protein
MKKSIFILIAAVLLFAGTIVAQNNPPKKENCGDCGLEWKCQPTKIKNNFGNLEFGAYIGIRTKSGNCPKKFWVSYEIQCIQNGKVWWSGYCYSYEPNRDYKVSIGAMNSIYTGEIRLTKVECDWN